LTQDVRNGRLNKLMSMSDIETIKWVGYEVCMTKDQVMDIYRRYIEQGFEGAIVKNMTGLYQFKRSKNWLKIKPNIGDIEVTIESFEEGTGKYVGMVGNILFVYNNLLCSVGTGLSDEQRIEFWQTKNELVGSIMTIKAMEHTEDGRLRHPVFVCMRSFKGSMS